MFLISWFSGEKKCEVWPDLKVWVASVSCLSKRKRIAGTCPFLESFSDCALLICFRHVLTRILDIIRETCLRPRSHSIISLEATCSFFNVRVSTARFLHLAHRLLVHFSCLWQMEKLLKLLNSCTDVMVSWFGWWYVVVLTQIFLQELKKKWRLLIMEY